jgi:hypothetical protein
MDPAIHPQPYLEFAYATARLKWVNHSANDSVSANNGNREVIEICMKGTGHDSSEARV